MRVLFVTNAPVGARRSGPAIRAVELGRVLSREHEVTVCSLQGGEPEKLEGLTVITGALRDKSALRAAAKSSDVVVTQGMVLARYPALEKQARHLVVDLYDAYLFEYLQHAHPRHASWGYLRQWYRLNQQMLAGDFFLCANQRQRDYWLGRLCALGRLNPREHERDSSFESLLAVVPFGLPAEPPQKNGRGLREVISGIGKDDFVLLWAGGMWEWLDPLTPIRALQTVAEKNPKIKLVFLGTQDPDASNRPMTMPQRARRLAQELGVLGKSVFFHEEWAPYDQRQNFLLEADAGISAHPATVESRYAFRTRVLDYLWAGLPMILSGGDEFGELAASAQFGLRVEPGSVEEWQRAILQLGESAELRHTMRQNSRRMAARFHWEKIAAPLAAYCARPYRTTRASGLRKKLAPLLSSGYDLARGLRG